MQRSPDCLLSDPREPRAGEPPRSLFAARAWDSPRSGDSTGAPDKVRTGPRARRVQAWAGRAPGPSGLTHPSLPLGGLQRQDGSPLSRQSPHCGLHRGLRSLTDRGNPRRDTEPGCVQTTSLSPPNPEPSRQLESAFPRIQQEKKKGRKGRGPGVAGQAGALEPSRLSCPSGAMHSGVSTRAGRPSLFCPGFSSLRPALDSQPCSPSASRSAGHRGERQCWRRPPPDPAVEGLPWHRRIPSEFWPPVGCRVVNH